MNKTVKYILIGVTLAGGGYLIYTHFKKKKAGSMFNDIDSNQTEKIVTIPAKSGDFPIKNGSRGEKVKQLQTKLGVTADGIFGPKTEAALQSKAGVTSIANEAAYVDTLTKLSGAIKKASESSAKSNRATSLYNQFKSGTFEILPTNDSVGERGLFDSFGGFQRDGKKINLKKGLRLNNTDYKLVGTTSNTGMLQMKVTRGTLEGLYLVNPNHISLVATNGTAAASQPTGQASPAASGIFGFRF